LAKVPPPAPEPITTTTLSSLNSNLFILIPHPSFPDRTI
jgi:hypothetical protein